MSNIVLQLSTEIQNEIKTYYATSTVERNAPGVIFAAKLPDTAITIYKSGKVMFQGIGAKREASRWGEVKEKILYKTLTLMQLTQKAINFQKTLL